MSILDDNLVYILDISNKKVLDIVKYKNNINFLIGYRNIYPNIDIGMEWKVNINERLNL